MIHSGHKISMTEVNHCYENAVAERVNKTLKFEFGLRYTFDSFKVSSKRDSTGRFSLQQCSASSTLRFFYS
ncbi:hypothetical protein LEP1GSC005_1402 [Leptospira santarosai str. ST188]|nr:hypothetical protein LEP1GSC005_1402 [Leptospira santarosai str. ST188]